MHICNSKHPRDVKTWFGKNKELLDLVVFEGLSLRTMSVFWPRVCRNQHSYKHWQLLCSVPLTTPRVASALPFSPWLQSITLQNSLTLFSLISSCLRSINADILRSIWENEQERGQWGLDWWAIEEEKKNQSTVFFFCCLVLMRTTRPYGLHD